MLFHATLSLAEGGHSHHLTLRPLLFREGGGREPQYPLAEWASEHVWIFWREDHVLTLPGIEHRLHVTCFVLTEYGEM